VKAHIARYYAPTAMIRAEEGLGHRGKAKSRSTLRYAGRWQQSLGLGASLPSSRKAER
jgi:hypothetical protein